MPGPIGFIGVGHMGQPMARNLLKSGFELCVYDLHPEQAAPLVALGAHQAFRLSDVAALGGIVITMVPDDQALEEVVLSEGGILEQLGANGIHVSMSTVSPQSAERFAALYAKQGSCYLAATVLGRPDVASSGAPFDFSCRSSCRSGTCADPFEGAWARHLRRGRSGSSIQSGQDRCQ